MLAAQGYQEAHEIARKAREGLASGSKVKADQVK